MKMWTTRLAYDTVVQEIRGVPRGKGSQRSKGIPELMIRTGAFVGIVKPR